MRGTISGRLRNTELPRSKPLLPLFKAIINSLQSLSERQSQSSQSRSFIKTDVYRQSQTDTEKLGSIERIEVTDNCIVFSSKDLESFNIIGSEYKARLGGKGLGRFMWLKAFDRVEIESHFFEEASDEISCRKFVFDANYKEDKAVVARSNEKQPWTKVSLCSFREPYRDSSPKSTDVLVQRIIGHFLPVFLNPDAPRIELIDALHKWDLCSYCKEYFLAGSTQQDFFVGSKTFSLRGYRLF